MIRKGLNVRGKKAAGVTVELMLAITLAIVVLFFILSIFGDNLKAMVASSGIQNMYQNNQKTTFSRQQYDPTQVNVQVLAEQGNTFTSLQDAKDKAKAKIDGYLANPPQNEEQVLDLAKWATIARIVADTEIINSSVYANLIIPNGIHIYTEGGFKTKVTTANTSSLQNLVINKQFIYNFKDNTNDLRLPEQKLSVANEIVKASYVAT